MAQLPFATLDLSGDYITHDVTLYAHGHATEPDGINAAVKNLETVLKAFDLDDYALGGAGDMPKATYDTDDDGVVDAAEALNDGTNTVTAAALRDHLDNHPAGGDLVGGLVTVSASRAVLAEECAGHLIEATAIGVTLTLPEVSTLPDNARLDIASSDGIPGFTAAASGSDMIYWEGHALSTFSSSSDANAYLRLRKVTGGWLCLGSNGFYVGE